MAVSRLRWVRGLRLALEHSLLKAAEPGVIDRGAWRPRAFLHVHHPDATQCGGLQALQREVERLRPLAAPAGCHVVVAMVIRHPWEFYNSWYVYSGAGARYYQPSMEGMGWDGMGSGGMGVGWSWKGCDG